MKQVKSLVAAVVLFFGAQVVSAQSKVAHIDVSALMSNLPAMKAAEAQIGKMRETYDAEYKKMVGDYQTKLAQYQKEAEEGKVSDAMNQTRAQEMQDMGGRIQKFQEEAQKSLQDKAIDLQKPLMEKAQAIIHKVARAKGYQYVLDSTNGSGVILADGPNLLDEVKKELETATATPAPATPKK